jgi:hypothetical protein
VPELLIAESEEIAVLSRTIDWLRDQSILPVDKQQAQISVFALRWTTSSSGPCLMRSALLGTPGAGRLEDRGPASDLAFHQLGQRLGRACRPFRQHAAQFEKPLARGHIIKPLRQRVIELRHDLLGRSLGGSRMRLPVVVPAGS